MLDPLVLYSGTGFQVDGRFESAVRCHGNLGIVTYSIDRTVRARVFILYTLGYGVPGVYRAFEK